MVAAARKTAENTRIEKWDNDKARDWLLRQAQLSADSSFVVTTRNLAARWCWSKAGVSNFLKTMELSGQITREILPNNGGTRITIAERCVVPVVVPLKGWGEQSPDDGNAHALFSIADIETVRSTPSQSLVDKLAQAYQGIIYDKPGFEHCDVEHLELIEQTLFPDMCPSLQQAA